MARGSLTTRVPEVYSQFAVYDTLTVGGIDLEIQDCCNCGTVFAAPKRILDNRRKSGGNFYCPNGHSMVFTETEVDRAKKRAQQAEERAASLIAELDQERAAHRSTKGQLTKTKKRVAGGVCPCCNRSFVQLARHMKGQHPEYADA